MHEVMVPRTDIVAIYVETPARRSSRSITTSGHSRIPIYEGSPDNIIGMVYAKDLFDVCARRAGRPSSR